MRNDLLYFFVALFMMRLLKNIESDFVGFVVLHVLHGWVAKATKTVILILKSFGFFCCKTVIIGWLIFLSTSATSATHNLIIIQDNDQIIFMSRFINLWLFYDFFQSLVIIMVFVCWHLISLSLLNESLFISIHNIQ